MNNAPSILRKTAPAGCSWPRRMAGMAAVKVHQDAELSIAVLANGKELTYSLKPGRRAWLQVARGRATVNGTALEAGDGAAITDETMLAVRALEDAEILLFDLA